MISWMAARCDFPEYGKMLFYQLPKEKLIYGPMQIEAMIDQNTMISQQLTLWDQKGSRVIRGNLIAVPIENSFLYVVPVYLTAAGTNFPQLKRVIVISGDKVAMEPTLDEAIQSVFGTQQPQAERQRAADRRSWARRGRSSMRPRRQCSRAIGETSARRWRGSSACWPDHHNRIQQSGKTIPQFRNPCVWDLKLHTGRLKRSCCVSNLRERMSPWGMHPPHTVPTRMTRRNRWS